MGASGFIVPFMFVYGPPLLLIGSLDDILTTVTASSIGVTILSAGLMGWLLKSTTLLERATLMAAAILLMKPGIFTDLLGLFLVGLVLILQRYVRGVSWNHAGSRGQERPFDKRA